MDADGWPLLLFAMVLFLIGGGYFAATEIAFAAMNKLRVKKSAEDGDRRAQKAMCISENFDSALTTILIGNNVMHVGCASIATLLATRAWGAGSVAVTSLVVTVVVFLFCEMLPKSYAKQQPERFAMAVSGSLFALMRAMKPLTRVFSAFAGLVSRLFPAEDAPSYTEDELQDIMETIEDEGVLEPDQQELVQSAFEFGDKSARDILIPLDRVACVDVRADQEEIARVLGMYKYSRFPVYDGTLDHLIGLMQANAYYSAMLRGDYKGIRPLLLPLRSYAADMHIDDLMAEMNQRRQHMAAITDASGKTIGIVTMEDILEELVGDIYDEDDVAVEPASGC